MSFDLKSNQFTAIATKCLTSQTLWLTLAPKFDSGTLWDKPPISFVELLQQ